MSLAANSSITLNKHTPKKDATVNNGTGAPTTGTDDVSIWAAANIDPYLGQQLVGDFTKLHRWAQSTMVSLTGTPAIVHMPLGGSDADIELNGTPTADELRLEIGAGIHGPDQSHFLDRTFKRLIERWLEETKDNS